MKQFIFILVILYILILTGVETANAATTPTFSSCVVPPSIDSAIADYASGTHGIAGDLGTHTGSDTVYALSDRAVMQCFCQDNGTGIQTNWWNTKDLSLDEIKIAQNQGWMYIQSGSAWGLSNDPYLAQNTTFTCKGSTNSTSNNSSNSNSNNNSQSNNGSNGFVQGIASFLAATGTMVTLFIALILGISFSTFGFVLKRNSH